MVHLSCEQFSGTSVAICISICAQIIIRNRRAEYESKRVYACVSLSLDLGFCSEHSVHVAANVECLVSELMVTFLRRCLCINKALFV